MKNWEPLVKQTVNDAHLPVILRELEVWGNDIYTVFVRRNMPTAMEGETVTWLSIKRNDKEPITDWRHKQWIKNQLVGEKNEGCEIYPSEERIVDGSNQYHLWVFENPMVKFPFGFDSGRVQSRYPIENGKQNPWPKNMLPGDIEENENKLNQELLKLNKTLNKA